MARRAALIAMEANPIGANFSQTYREARSKFMAAADVASLPIRSHVLPLPGKDGEQLAMDVVLDGPADAASLLIVSSGCHGVEGYCGSGVQVTLLQDPAFRAAARDARVAVLYVHALNPYGFSWWRRTTEENIDLNRNFQDFTRPLPVNAGYEELAAAIMPPTWPPEHESESVLHRYAAVHGMDKVQEAITSGQYAFADGVFYGGRAPSWSNLTLRQVLREHALRCRRLGWIDLHTGLGPLGVGERILACRDDAAALARARAWWGEQVTSMYDGGSTSARLQGLMCTAVYEECPQAEYTGIALEYGTFPLLEMLNALRADQWLQNHPEAPAELARRIKQGTRDAFYVDTDAWKQQIIDQAMDAAHGALRGLSAPGG